MTGLLRYAILAMLPVALALVAAGVAAAVIVTGRCLGVW